jgi:hypothetical protein
LLETGYFFLKLDEKLMAQTRLPCGVKQKIISGSVASLYSNSQPRDALNMFASLISIIRESPTQSISATGEAILLSIPSGMPEFVVVT